MYLNKVTFTSTNFGPLGFTFPLVFYHYPSLRVVKIVFVIREWPNFFPVKCEVACFISREFWFHFISRNCERTNLFFMKHDVDSPFTTFTSKSFSRSLLRNTLISQWICTPRSVNDYYWYWQTFRTLLQMSVVTNSELPSCLERYPSKTPSCFKLCI